MTETEWIARFTGGVGVDVGGLDLPLRLEVIRAGELRTELALKQGYLDTALREVEGIHKTLKAFSEAQLKVLGGVRNKMDMIATGGDPTQSFGFTKDVKDLLESPKNLTELYEAQRQVVAIRNSLQRHTVKRSVLDDEDAPTAIVQEEGALFDADDLEAGFYTTLVRQLLYPEELVPDEFSQVQRMIDQTNKLYLEKLATIAPVTPNPMEEFGPLIQAVTSAAAQVATSSVSITENTDEWKTIANTGIKIAEAVINTGIAIGVQISRADAGGIVGKAFEGLSAGVEAALAQWLPIDDAQTRKDIAKLVGLSMKGAGHFTIAVKDILTKPTIEEQTAAMIGGVQGLLNVSYDCLQVGESEDNKRFIKYFQTGVNSALGMAKTAVEKKLADAIRKRDTATIRSICLELGAQVVKTGVAMAANAYSEQLKKDIDEDKDGKLRQQANDNYAEWKRNNPTSTDTVDDYYAGLKKTAKASVDSTITDAVGETGTGGSGLAGSLGSLMGTLDKRALDEKAEVARRTLAREQTEQQEEEAKDADERIKEAQEAFEERLRLLDNPENDESDQKLIASLIADIKRDKAILNAVFAAAKLGTGVAAAFFAPMAAAGKIVQFLQESTIAIQRLIHLRKWMDSKKGAMNAVSPYFSAITAFCESLGVQLTHHTIQAACAMIQAGAKIAQTAGAGTPAQGVGAIVDAAAGLTASVEELCYAVYKKAALEKAWKVTKKALANPGDRKTNQIARNLNPTFAKYTIAWGSYVAKDPVATEAVGKIGLTPLLLRAPDAGVARIVEFLETLYDEDIQVYRHHPDATDWVKETPEPAIRVGAWTTTYFVATSKGELRPDSGGTTNDKLVEAFATAQRAGGAWRKTDTALKQITVTIDDDKRAVEPATALTDVRDAYDAYLRSLQTLLSLLQAYKPVHKTSGKDHTEMKQIVRDFIDLVEADETGVQLRLPELERLEEEDAKLRAVKPKKKRRKKKKKKKDN